MSLLSLKNIHIDFGSAPLLDGANLIIKKSDRLCILGRNGAGKSTLLKIIAGNIQPDKGEILQQGHIVVATLPQEIPSKTNKTVYEVVLTDFQQQHAQAWEIETKINTALTKLGLNPTDTFDSLSGGYKRRVLLAKALAESPDILLMDEPTNHLDLSGITWLETFVKSFSGAIVFITHDRTFLQNIANKIAEIDRGKLTEFTGDYKKYCEQKAHLLEVEEQQNKKFDQNLKNEEIWIRQGVKARRTRNEGRVSALKKLREERAARREKTGQVDFKIQDDNRSGKLVLQAQKIHYAYQEQTLIHDFSTTILRGDKIGIIGDNGCGKSTLIQILLQKLMANAGTVKHGTNLEIAYFDQHREQLDLEKTVAENVSYGDQFVNFNGSDIHIMSYLKQFLFPPEQANVPVKTLSGGERNRLLLARLFSQPANFLVLDEPTNDLDLETLELLEDLLVNYTGTLLLVSHDRAFINNVVTSTMVFEGDGKVQEYVGGYDDWRTQTNAKPKVKEDVKKKKIDAAPKQNYLKQKEIRTVESKINTLETKIQALEQALASTELYQSGQEKKLAENQKQLKDYQTQLSALYQQWETLLT